VGLDKIFKKNARYIKHRGCGATRQHGRLQVNFLSGCQGKFNQRRYLHIWVQNQPGEKFLPRF